MTLKPWHLLLLATLLTLGALATHGHAQEHVSAEVLGDDSLIALDPLDTYVTNASEPDDPHEDNTATLGGDGEDAYLLSPSTIGGEGLDPRVVDRYENGDITNATLVLRHDGRFGCAGESGTFTVRSIETPSWDPRSIVWNETTLADPDADVDILGPVLGQAKAGYDEGNCSRADIPLDIDHLEPIFQGQKGGLSVVWEGTHSVTLQTTNHNTLPTLLHIRLDTNAARVTNATLSERHPAYATPGESIAINATLKHPHLVSSGGLVADFYDETGAHEKQAIFEQEQADTWVARTSAPLPEGLYDITLNVEDDLAWTTGHNLAPDGWSLVVDDTPPTITNAHLDGQEPGNVTADQFDQIPLTATIQEISCEALTDPCARWEATWGPPDDPLAGWSGAITPNDDGQGIIQDTLTLPRPGDDTLTLTIQDPIGHERTTTWRLQVNDTQPPTAKPLDGTWIAPNINTTVKEEQPAPLHFEVIDDLPVNATLHLVGPTTEQRPLGTLTDDHQLQEEIQPPQAGEYDLSLHLDDGTHTTKLDWGTLIVTPARGPTIHMDPIDRRISPTTPVTVHLVDDNLDPEATQVTAQTDGEPLTPHVDTEETTDGAELALTIRGLQHDANVEITVRAQDNVGHETQETATFTMDREPPQLLRPDDHAWHQPGSAITLDAADPGGGTVTITASTPQQTLELAPPTSISLSSLIPEREGLHEVAFLLEDDRGNQHEVTRQVGIDGTPPDVNVTLDAGGILIHAKATGSNVTSLDVHTGVNTDSISRASTVEQRPGVHRVLGMDDLARGDLVYVAVSAMDAAGNDATLGSIDDPLAFEHPGDPPGLELERTTPPVGDAGGIRWEAWDPEGTPLGVSVTLHVTPPGGDTELHEGLRASGQHTINPEEEGRYVVEATAHVGNRTTNETLIFRLSPNGEGTRFESLPERISPGEGLEVTLQTPSEPEDAYVRAIDGSDLQHQASSITWQDGELVALFESLPEGDYEISAVIVHGPGLVEEVEMGSVSIASTMTESLRNAANMFLIVLVLGGMLIAGYAWYRMRGDSEPEDS